ncbi:MAG: Flp family type IVb pilin [Rhodomicrobiaceae bacterium]
MRSSFSALVKRFAREERGASFVEYAMLTGLVAAIVVAAIAVLNGSITTLFGNLSTTISAINTGGAAPN